MWEMVKLGELLRMDSKGIEDCSVGPVMEQLCGRRRKGSLSQLCFWLEAGAAEGALTGTASPGEGGFGGGHECSFRQGYWRCVAGHGINRCDQESSPG